MKPLSVQRSARDRDNAIGVRLHRVTAHPFVIRRSPSLQLPP